MNRKTLGGAAFLVAATFMGREALVWAFNKVLDAVSSGINGGVSFVSLSWQNAVAIIFAIVGFALVLWPKPEAKPASQAAATPSVNYGRLLRAANSIIHRVRDHRGTTALWRDKLEPTGDITRAGMSTLLSFEKAGFVVPDFRNEQYSENVAVGLETYFSAIVTFLADGHIEEAKHIAVDASKRAEAAARSFNIHSWFHREY